ncbi:leucine-rich PPR motif-containing protein, mitochondrial [Pectinophora gossypiella]|uniref:leucine-rich PPR motif-containing protein, mitochondrial n=1 Tax=Pectinophora gossypiella TaxID=13191 RepID=UPI00214E0709|nr:leucine-rich PPR motif-containing protein, mitochondrial [Pectinophora gossypiella]
MSLLRSTKFVRYFTGAARTLILNSAKTAEANLLVNPKALCAANNVVLRDYATSKKKESLEPLLQKLDAEVRRFGRITKRDIDEVFDEIKAKNDITSSQSLLVIRCCGELVPEELPEQRTLLVQKIWNVLTERGVPMDISHYNALLRVYLENEHPFSPAKFLEELELKGLQPNRVTYQRLMWRYCQEGDVEGATKVLEKMRELNFPVSEPVLNALVMGHAFHGDTNGAKAVLETMSGAGLQPTNRTYTLLACGYAKQGDIDGVENVIKTATEKDAYMTDKDILDIIEQMALGGHGDKVEKLFPHLLKGAGYNQDVCNVILRLLNKGHEETAKKIMKTMPKSPNFDETLFKGAFFIKQLLRLNRPADSFIKTCNELKQEGLVPGAFFIATEGALQMGNVELALKLFQELQKEGMEIRQHYFWPLLARKGKEGDEEGLLQIVRDMVKSGCSPTGEALRDYIIPYLIKKDNPDNVIVKLQIASVPAIHTARNVIIDLLDAGKTKKAAEVAVQYRPRGQFQILWRPLLNSLGQTRDIDSFATIVHVISSPSQTIQTEEDSTTDEAHSTDSSDEIGRLVKSAVKNLSKPDLCEKLLNAFYAKGMRISTEAAEAIEQYLGKDMTTGLSELLSKLTSADLEPVPLESQRRIPLQPRTTGSLEQLLAQAKSKGSNNVNRIQKQLLSAYIKENNLEKVNSFLPELKASNFELSVATLAQLFEFYCVNNDVDKAKQIEAEIKEKDPSFVLNKFKRVEMAYALVRAQKYDEAVAYFKENKPKVEDDNNNFLFNSKCWQILNSLAEAKEDGAVKELTKVLIENNYVEPSNVLLGPSIKVHILKDDIEGALKEFENCCKLYRSTPWKGELMKQLIMKEDATRLQWVADMSTQIHGEVNILHDLVLAFVECGRLRQARRILETPGMQTRQRRLDDACQRYVEEGKSEHLEGLLEATKELNHIDRSHIFYHLLVTYCQAEQTDKALGLWTLLQEEGEVPSDQFLIYLGKHLKSKNREVPFAMPEDPKSIAPQKSSKSKNEVVQKIVTPKQPAKPTKKIVSENIEELVKNGKASQAMDIAVRSIEEGVIPKASVIKFMLKNLAQEGNVEKIQQLGKYINENMRREVTYDDKLTLAIFTRGAGSQHIDNLYEAVNAANTENDLEIALKKFPRSNALASIINNNDLIQKCHKVAELAASRGQLMPANLLWMEYVLAGKNQEAESLWKLWLSKANVLVFRRLLQEAHTKNDPQLIETLINALKSNQKISEGSLGNAFSRLINLYLTNSKTSEAIKVYEQAKKLGVTANSFNKNCLKRLQDAAKAEGKEVNVV